MVALGGGTPGTVPRHPDPQRAGTDRATHGHRQGDGLAIDADGNPFRAGGNHDGPRGQHAQAGGVPAAEQADRLPHAVHRHGDHAEHTAIQPRATAKARDVSRPVGVAGHQKRLRRIDRHAVRDGGQPCPALAVQQLRQRVQGRAQLVVPVGGRLHHLSVGAEGRVVDKRLIADQAQVDLQINAVGQRGEARRRIRAVEAQVQREVVPGARGDHHERNPVLSGDTGHERLGTVAACDAEQVTARR